MGKVVKAILVLFIFAIIYTLLRNCVSLLEYIETSESYPAFDVHARNYHSTKEIKSAMRLDNNLNPFYTWFDLTPEVNSEPLKIYGYGPNIVNISHFRLRVFILCNQHAREVVTAELCYHLIRLLQLQTRDDYLTTQLKQQTMNGVGYWIVPVGNPWGRQLVETNLSRGCQRVNANGVDLNRNFPSVHSRRYVRNTEEEYPGEEPFSEYETQAVTEFAEFAQPHLVLNVHSGGNDILLPFDGDDEQLPPRYTRLLQIAAYARKGVCPECNIGSSSMIYPPADGTFVDYMLMNGGAPLAYTLEIFSKATSSDALVTGRQCQHYFNPDEGDELAHTMRKWATIVVRITEKITTLIKT